MRQTDNSNIAHARYAQQEEIYGGALGLSKEELAELRAKGVI